MLHEPLPILRCFLVSLCLCPSLLLHYLRSLGLLRDRRLLLKLLQLLLAGLDLVQRRLLLALGGGQVRLRLLELGLEFLDVGLELGLRLLQIGLGLLGLLRLGLEVGSLGLECFLLLNERHVRQIKPKKQLGRVTIWTSWCGKNRAVAYLLERLQLLGRLGCFALGGGNLLLERGGLGLSLLLLLLQRSLLL